ncbi:ribosome recycling factor [candidate division WWE3 bacterium RBG_19FT_COMBO_34_6]|uniref:Ribosome-recycling factor n=1 Tax=candidate division WWE3 bacterium RBG_19FT_COMBO_34_6 TaxID=1802612 RepID=A0A1F4UMY2_UNCKA|nr:MAG: ribosome recycling factor [candidate division WWE3 bacterium RBG_19FT_COMBO_34_6]
MNSIELKNKLIKSLDHLKSELTQIRTGRANPSLLEGIMCEAYGAKMHLKELGSISLSDAHTIIITPWDKNLLGVIRNAIRDSELNLNPLDAGGTLRVPVPPLTEDRRKDLTKLVSQKVEETKQSIRNIRQETMKEIDKEFESKEISEDEKFLLYKKVEEIVKEYANEAEESGQIKNKEILTI